MVDLKINDAPVRTCRHFEINNIKLKDVDIPLETKSFTNFSVSGIDNVGSGIMDYKLRFGLGDVLENQVRDLCNNNLKIDIPAKSKRDIQILYNLDCDNKYLIENIDITAEENSNSRVVIKYQSENGVSGFHNGIIRINAKENARIDVLVVNFLNENSYNFISMENSIGDNSNIKYTIVDFGGKCSITNYFSDIVGYNANNILNTIYLGRNEQLFDLNYIGELRGEKSNIDIEVQGALKDSAKKHFKGTIDFKKGCKKAKGNENEFCTLLSEKARSIALPMLLCSEEEVEGNHSSAAGKIDEKILFYIMSRGFTVGEAMKLIVRAKFNGIIQKIKNEDIRQEILDEIDKRLG